jgi:hypothetical protein
MRSMPRRSGFCSAVVTVEVATPLMPTLNGGAAVFSRAAGSSLALRSVVARLAAVSVRDTVGVCAAIDVHDSAGDGSGDPREWLALRPP